MRNDEITLVRDIIEPLAHCALEKENRPYLAVDAFSAGVERPLNRHPW